MPCSKYIGWVATSPAFISGYLFKVLSEEIAQRPLLFHTPAPFSLKSSFHKDLANTNLRSSFGVPTPHLLSTCDGITNDFIFQVCAMSFFCQQQIFYLSLVQTPHSIPAHIA
jgi:hypothetical protein